MHPVIIQVMNLQRQAAMNRGIVHVRVIREFEKIIIIIVIIGSVPPGFNGMSIPPPMMGPPGMYGMNPMVCFFKKKIIKMTGNYYCILNYFQQRMHPSMQHMDSFRNRPSSSMSNMSHNQRKPPGNCYFLEFEKVYVSRISNWKNNRRLCFRSICGIYVEEGERVAHQDPAFTMPRKRESVSRRLLLYGKQK